MCWGSAVVMWDCHQASLQVLGRFPSVPCPALAKHCSIGTPPGREERQHQKESCNILPKFPMQKKKSLGKPGGLRRCGGGQSVAEDEGRVRTATELCHWEAFCCHDSVMSSLKF